MKKLVLLLSMGWLLSACAVNVTNYPQLASPRMSDMFLLSSITDKTNYNLTWQQLSNAVKSVPVYSALTYGSTNFLLSGAWGVVGDSDVVNGGGTDDSAALQRMLDQATNGPIEIVLDRCSLISTSLVIKSGTTIRGVNRNAGLFAKAGSHLNAMIWNGWPSVWVTNVTIASMTLNGNGFNQIAANGPLFSILSYEAWVSGIIIYGGDNVTIRDCTLYNNTGQTFTGTVGFPGFQIYVAALKHFTLENCDLFRCGSGGNDSLHFLGPMGVARVLHNHFYVIPGGPSDPDDTIGVNIAEQNGQPVNMHNPSIFPNTDCSMESLYIEDIVDLGAHGGLVSFHDNGDPGNLWRLTNCVIKNVRSDFSSIDFADALASNYGWIGNLIIENVHNTALFLSGRRVGNLTVRGYYVDEPVPANAAVAAYPQLANPFLHQNPSPLYPSIILSDIVSNTIISDISGTFNYGYTNPIVDLIVPFYPSNTNQPNINIYGVNVTGDSPVFGNLAQNGIYTPLANYPPKGTVTMDNIYCPAGPIIASNAPSSLVVSGVFTSTNTPTAAVVGSGILWQSNSVLYWTTMAATNLINNGKP